MKDHAYYSGESGEMFVDVMADFLKQGKSAQWILERAERAFAAEDINQIQLRRVEALVGE